MLHVAETVRGGIATYFNELRPFQQAAFGNENVHFVIPSDHRNDLTDFAEEDISTFLRLGRNLQGLFHMAIETLRQIRRMRPDIVHIHSTFAGLVIRPLLLLSPGRPQIVYCPHGWAFSRETSKLSHQTTKFIERLLAKTTDRIICISGDELKEGLYAGIERERMALVNNGISANRALAEAPDVDWNSQRMKVLFVGRLDRQKGWDLLIDAARELNEIAEIRIIGSFVVGSQKAVDLPSNVTLLGWMNRQQIEAYLEIADIVVIPSRWEAFGLVALEAMRAAKPIVAFRVGALPEIVEDGVTGILCFPISAAALTTALKGAAELDLPAAGRRGYERFRRMYDVEQTHNVLSGVYRELVQGDKAIQ